MLGILYSDIMGHEQDKRQYHHADGGFISKQQQKENRDDNNRPEGIAKEGGKRKVWKESIATLSTQMWERLFAYNMKRFHHPCKGLEFINSHERNTGNYINAYARDGFNFFLDLFGFVHRINNLLLMTFVSLSSGIPSGVRTLFRWQWLQ